MSVSSLYARQDRSEQLVGADGPETARTPRFTRRAGGTVQTNDARALGEPCHLQAITEPALLHWRTVAVGGEGGRMMPLRCRLVPAVPSSSFSGSRFPPEIIVLAVRWYLRYGLSYRDVEELLTERGTEVDHVTVYRWVQRFTPLLVDAAQPCRHAVGNRWFVDETYVKIAGRWRYVYRAVDQYGQIIDVYVSARRDTRAARRFFAMALGAHSEPAEVVTDLAWTLRVVVDELLPSAFHNTEQYANNRIEADHGRLKARLRPIAPSLP